MFFTILCTLFTFYHCSLYFTHQCSVATVSWQIVINIINFILPSTTFFLFLSSTYTFLLLFFCTLLICGRSFLLSLILFVCFFVYTFFYIFCTTQILIIFMQTPKIEVCKSGNGKGNKNNLFIFCKNELQQLRK